MSDRRRLWQYLGGILGLALVQRLLMVLFYQPVPYSDTASYRRLGQQFVSDWWNYDGTRTPGYPLFLALVGPDERVWLVQMALGVFITLLVFALGWLLTRQAGFAALGALAHLLNLGQWFFEADMLSETLATFLVVLALTGAVWGMGRKGWRAALLAFGLGLAASLALLVRPLFIYFPPWLFLFIWFAWDRERGFLRRNLWSLAAFTLPVLALVGGWVNFIHARYGEWALSTMTGYHLMQHTGVFFEYVPDEYAVLRDTYLEYRDAKIARTGSQANTIWEAIPPMQAASGLNFHDLERTLAKISVQLILDHPDKYLRNVLRGWWIFWYAPVYWSAEALRIPALAPLLRIAILAQRGLLFACNWLFIVTSLLAFFWPRFRAWTKLTIPWIFLLLTIWGTSILQTLIEHGDNPRFLVPLQTIVVLWGLWLLARVKAKG